MKAFVADKAKALYEAAKGYVVTFVESHKVLCVVAAVSFLLGYAVG